MPGAPANDFPTERCTYRSFVDARCDELTKAFGLEAKVLASQWADLSGGERHRAMLALVVALSPSVLVLDEPTGSCDSKTASMVEATLAHESASGISTIWVTHDAEQADRVAHRQLHLVAKETRWPEV